MKIIKHGSKYSENKIAICPLCGCEFEYDNNDTGMDKAFCFTTFPPTYKTYVKLKQMLEELYRTQQARLDVGADDLDIREEIAEVEEEIKELQDETMEEDSIKNERSSIEEDIILLKDFTEGNFKRDKLENYKGSYKMGCFYYKDIQRAIEHIILDYKRVLKENEILKKEKEQAWEEWNNLEQGSYETEQKLKQQIKKLQEENEKLIYARNWYFEHTVNKICTPEMLDKILRNDYISKQKLKDKIRKNEEIIDISNDGDLIHELLQKNKVYEKLLESEE